MSTWDVAAVRVGHDDDPSVEPPKPDDDEIPIPPRAPGEPPEVLLIDHFSFAHLDLSNGARVKVSRLNRIEASRIAGQHNVEVALGPQMDRSLAFIEKELQIPSAPRYVIGPHVRTAIAIERHAWNDVRWYLIEWESDADGVIG